MKGCSKWTPPLPPPVPLERSAEERLEQLGRATGDSLPHVGHELALATEQPLRSRRARISPERAGLPLTALELPSWRTLHPARESERLTPFHGRTLPRLKKARRCPLT